MYRSFLIFAVAFVALMAGALFYAAQAPVRAPAPPPEPASTERELAFEAVYPSFSMPDVDGVVRSFSDWDGNHRIVNFWATWCAPCRREIPLLKAFHAEHADAGIQVIGIAVDFAEEVAAYAEDAQFNYPVLIGEEDAMAIAESTGIDFIGLPFTMIVAADGELLNAHLGEIHQDDLDHIAAVLARLDAGELDKAGAREALASL